MIDSHVTRQYIILQQPNILWNAYTIIYKIYYYWSNPHFEIKNISLKTVPRVIYNIMVIALNRDRFSDTPVLWNIDKKICI